jgi:hypothetical protein
MNVAVLEDQVLVLTCHYTHVPNVQTQTLG